MKKRISKIGAFALVDSEVPLSKKKIEQFRIVCSDHGTVNDSCEVC